MSKFSTKSLFIALSGVVALSASAQNISTIEDVDLGTVGYYNGKDGAGSFNSNAATFKSIYNAQYDYWSGGFAASSHIDAVTEGYANMYSSYAGSGADNSAKFVVGAQGGIIVTGGRAVNSIQITNSTYAALSMKNGDSFGKKFGGTTGNDEDYFRLIISAFRNGSEKTEKVTFYLADYRSADNSQDYILKNWTAVDLSSLGNADSLKFTLESSDVGQYGINTPTYFCADNLNLGAASGISTIETKKLAVFPNPVVDQLFVSESLAGKNAMIYSISGALVKEVAVAANGSLDLSALTAGVYTIFVADEQSVHTAKFVKQ
ncbi:MAG: DUF4465 domain-containing protein [Bacteroidota bacterium]